MFGVLKKISEKANQYLDTRIQIVKLDLIERTTGLVSFFMFALVSMFLLLLVLLFLGISAGEYFSGLLDSMPLGYLLSASMFLLLLVLMFLLRNPILRFFSNIYISLVTEKDDEDEEELDEL